MMRATLGLLCTCLALAASGCDRSPGGSEPAKPPAGNSAEKSKPAPDAAHGHGHGGETVDLGTTKLGELTIRASRDKGEVGAGADLPIDVWLTDAADKPAKVIAVRFWVGLEDAAGSIKAKAEIENPDQPGHWHTHVEAPDPLPAGSKLWVEIENPADAKTAASFDLKP